MQVIANHCEFGDKLCKSGLFLGTAISTQRGLAKPASLVLSSLPLFAATGEHSIIIAGCKTRRNDLHFYSGSSRAAFFPFWNFYWMPRGESNSLQRALPNSIENAPN